eukprot:252792-Chlamydomonas_euryale.AAC.2
MADRSGPFGCGNGLTISKPWPARSRHVAHVQAATVVQPHEDVSRLNVHWHMEVLTKAHKIERCVESCSQIAGKAGCDLKCLGSLPKMETLPPSFDMCLNTCGME